MIRLIKNQLTQYMKQIITILCLFLAFSSFSQIKETESLWRTKGVHDSTGNFITRAKIQSFLYAAKDNQFYRLRNQSRINMETGETKVFTYIDTLLLKPTKSNHFEVNEKEALVLHTEDSLTIEYNGYHIAYVKVASPKKKVSLKKLKKALLDKRMIENIANEESYAFNYQSNNLVKVMPLDSESNWESDYKIIDFEGFLILQGITSAPKLILNIQKQKITFLEIDYRFESKKGYFRQK